MFNNMLSLIKQPPVHLAEIVLRYAVATVNMAFAIVCRCGSMFDSHGILFAIRNVTVYLLQHL